MDQSSDPRLMKQRDAQGLFVLEESSKKGDIYVYVCVCMRVCGFFKGIK